jgi:hypothetical protein
MPESLKLLAVCLPDAQVKAIVEGPISAVVDHRDGSGTITVMGVVIQIPVGTPITTPTATLTMAQLADTTAFPGRSQPGFIGGVAIINGSSADGVITAADLFVAPAQHFLVGQITANQPLRVNGVRVQILNDSRMPGGVLRNIYEGFPVVPGSVPIGGAATVEGYFGVTGTLHATRVEVEGGTPAKVAPVRSPAKPRPAWGRDRPLNGT